MEEEEEEGRNVKEEEERSLHYTFRMLMKEGNH
jgi:hypothetical protein